jgi:hypothetical protein
VRPDLSLNPAFAVRGILALPRRLSKSPDRYLSAMVEVGPPIVALSATWLLPSDLTFAKAHAAGQLLRDSRMLNAVLTMVLFTAVLGPVLTQHFAPRMLEAAQDRPAKGNVST